MESYAFTTGAPDAAAQSEPEPLEPQDDEEPSPRGGPRPGSSADKRSKATKLQKLLVRIARDGMRRRNMTQAELAILSGLTQVYVSQLLSMSRPGTIDTWDRVLQVVKADYDALAD